MALPLRALMYVRQQTMALIPKKRRWGRFATKLQLAARLVEWIVPILKNAGRTVWIVVDGGYTKRPFLKPRHPERSEGSHRLLWSVACERTRRCATNRRS